MIALVCLIGTVLVSPFKSKTGACGGECGARSSSERAATVTAHLPKGNETSPTLVPKHEANTPEALKKRESAHAAKLRMFAERARQVVIGNSAAQMVNMV